ncbi:MAG: glycosyltransferase [Alphaproteobacteria bacterium]
MRILVFAAAEITVELICKPFIEELATKGHQIFICFPHKTTKSDWMENFDVIQIHQIDLRSSFIIRNILVTNKIEMMINFTVKPMVFGFLATIFLKNEPIVVNAFRGLGRLFQAPSNFYSRFIYSNVRLLLRVATKKANIVWLTNQSDLTELQCRGFLDERQSIIVTKNSINVERFFPCKAAEKYQIRKKHGLSLDTFIVVCVSRLMRDKGIGYFAEAIKALKKKSVNVTGVIVGPEDTSNLDAKFSVEDLLSVDFRRLPTKPSVIEYYHLADAAILASNYREGGYPRSLLEPMLCGLPVIASNTPFVAGAVDFGKVGLLVDVESSEQIERQILHLMNNSVLREKLRVNGREFVIRNFDQRQIAKNFVDELAKCLL